MTTRITIDPQVCGGRPIVAGTRMRVSDVLDALADGVSVEELLADFPYLVREDIHASPMPRVQRHNPPPPRGGGRRSLTEGEDAGTSPA